MSSSAPLALASSTILEPCVIADPDQHWQTYLSRTLKERGIIPTIASEAGGLEDACLELAPSLVLLDIDRPELRVTIEDIRGSCRGYLIGMTTRGQSAPASVEALLRGADLVLTKPFTREALLAQLDALGRRSRRAEAPEPGSVLVNGELRIDFITHAVEVGGRRVHLSRLQHRLLEALARNQDIVLTHAQLIDMVWGSTEDSSSATLRAHIHNLRRELGDTAARLIVTERDIGYYMPTLPV